MKHITALKIGGASGQGVKTAGYILTKALKNLGYWTFSYSEYPSLIKGGHSTFQINVADEKIHSATEAIDILLCLNEETISKHYELLNEEGFLLCDDDYEIPLETKNKLEKKKVNIVQVPVNEIVQKLKAKPVMSNSVLMGATWEILTSKFKPLEDQLMAIFKKKDKNTEKNLKCAEEGAKVVKSSKLKAYNLKPTASNSRIIGTGNEVAGLATYASGCRLYSAYPMTPSTGILHYLSKRAEKFGMVVKQSEDEMSAINAAIGASFAGTRAATGTSGGGLALMAESISLAGMTETPLVVFNVQRPAPATGMPTWTEQGDLSFAVNIGHGDFPRIILAPGDIDEMFDIVPKAFNLADKYQTVVFILSDKYLSESWYQTKKFTDKNIKANRGQLLSEDNLKHKKNFKRYQMTVSGISPRPIPGAKGGIYLSNSDEHDEKGYSTEDQFIRKEMMEKRMRKMSSISNELPEPELLGPKDAKTTIVTWGSQKGPVYDAIRFLNSKKPKVNILHYSYIYPLKTETLKKLSESNKLIMLENNFSGQFAKLIKCESDINIKTKILKYVGTPFFRDELVEILMSKL